jgi:hypothetical protein
MVYNLKAGKLTRAKKVDKMDVAEMVTDDVKKLAGAYVAGDKTVVGRALEAGISINVGIALRLHFKPIYEDMFVNELEIAKNLRPKIII